VTPQANFLIVVAEAEFWYSDLLPTGADDTSTIRRALPPPLDDANDLPSHYWSPRVSVAPTTTEVEKHATLLYSRPIFIRAKYRNV
jgi:hypothetical protein